MGKALWSGQWAYGPYVERFERKLCEVTGRRYAVATCTGTAAIHLATLLKFGGWPKWGCQVHSLTFVATANGMTYSGGEPTFVDLGPQTVIYTQMLGHTLPVGRWDMVDAAPALGTKNAGQQCDVAVFSFNGNKICSAGGGGALVTDDEGLAQEARHLANQAKSSPTEHDQVGFNYRMPNLNAALGLAQLERLPEFLERKQTLADRYERALGEYFWKPPEGSNNWLNAILVDNRDEVVSALNAAGYESRALHAPLHTLPMYRDCPRTDMTRTMDIWRRCVCLPSGAGLA